MPAGTNVPSGVLVTPGGQQGIPGPSTIGLPFVTKTAAYTLTSADVGKYIICSGGSWTLTLPSPPIGYFQVRNDMGITGTTGTITLAPVGGTIDGQASIPLLPQQECTLITDGTNWRSFGLKREVILGTQDITTSTASGTVLLPVGYRYFELEFTSVLVAVSPDYLVGQVSNNGGSAWTASGYYHSMLYNNSSTTAANFQVENDGSLRITQQLVGGLGQIPAHSKLVIFPAYPTWRFDGWSRMTGSLDNKWNGGGTNNASGSINAFKYYAASGNILNSFLTVKGVV